LQYKQQTIIVPSKQPRGLLTIKDDEITLLTLLVYDITSLTVMKAYHLRPKHHILNYRTQELDKQRPCLKFG